MNYRLTYDPATPANTKKLLKTLNDKAAEGEKTTALATVNESEVHLTEKGDDDDDDDSVLDGEKGDKKSVK